MATLSGVYYIKNVGTGRYLSITSPTANQPLAISPTRLDKKSQWRVSSTGSGTYKLKNEEYGLEVFRPSTTIVAQGAPEGFAFYITGPETGRKIHNRESTRDGTVLTQENLKGVDQVTSAKNNNSNKNQEWVFEKAEATDPGPGPGPGPEPEPEPEPTPGPGPNPGSTDYPLKPGRYRITNVKTGTVIDLEKMLPGDNQKIFGFAWNTGDNQKWDVQPSGTIPTMTLLCVATKKYATYQSFKPGTELRSDGKAQKLLIYPADKGAYYIGPEDKPGYVYTLYGRDNLQEDETPICLLINHGIDAQKWIFESV